MSNTTEEEKVPHQPIVVDYLQLSQYFDAMSEHLESIVKSLKQTKEGMQDHIKGESEE